jgi:hypothetical protein
MRRVRRLPQGWTNLLTVRRGRVTAIPTPERCEYLPVHNSFATPTQSIRLLAARRVILCRTDVPNRSCSLARHIPASAATNAMDRQNIRTCQNMINNHILQYDGYSY